MDTPEGQINVCDWSGLGLALDEQTDTAVANAIARITDGNFRLVERLFAQIQRGVRINDLATVTTEVVTVAGESLVLGPSERPGWARPAPPNAHKTTPFILKVARSGRRYS